MGTAGFANPSFATEPRKRGSLDSPLSNPGESLRRDIGLPRAYRDIGFRCPVQVANPHFDVRIGCFVFDPVSFAFQSGLFGIFRTFFIIGWKKDAVCVAFTHVFWITADRDYCSNFARCKSISPNRLGRTILEKDVRAV